MALRQIILLGRRDAAPAQQHSVTAAKLLRALRREGGREGVGAAVMRFLDT